jgi:hypothetical protein
VNSTNNKKQPLTCPTGILSPRGEEEVSNNPSESSLKRKKVTFPSPLGERVSAGRVRGHIIKKWQTINF